MNIETYLWKEYIMWQNYIEWNENDTIDEDENARWADDGGVVN